MILITGLGKAGIFLACAMFYAIVLAVLLALLLRSGRKESE